MVLLSRNDQPSSAPIPTSTQLTVKMLSSFFILLSTALVVQAQSPVSAIPMVPYIAHPSYSAGVNVSSVPQVAIHSNTDIGGGIGWTGPTTCVDGSVCICMNPCKRFGILFFVWLISPLGFSQCLPGSAPTTTSDTPPACTFSTVTCMQFDILFLWLISPLGY